jgi:hypothetical protein
VGDVVKRDPRESRLDAPLYQRTEIPRYFMPHGGIDPTVAFERGERDSGPVDASCVAVPEEWADPID